MLKALSIAILITYICCQMKRRHIPGPALMILSIIGIALFMFYWLADTYNREEKTLRTKTMASYANVVQQLQTTKLKLNSALRDSALPGIQIKKVIRNFNTDDSMTVSMPSKRGIVSIINAAQGRVKNTVKKDSAHFMIAINETTITNDCTRLNTQREFKKDDRFIQLLYNIDSLQDSLSVREIDSAFRKQMIREKTDIPFSIREVRGEAAINETSPNTITIGFARPVGYRLELGNTKPYLLRRIAMPVIFCLLLLGITILAFVLLYKNLLRQKRLGEIKNEFISNISHELKTPVATVGVAIEALSSFNAMQDPERTKEYLDISTNELQRLSLLIDKVLKLSMFENKELDLHYEDTDLKEITDEVLLSLKLQFEKQLANVSLDVKGNVHIQGDRLHLQSVIFNLLDNALKYSKANPVIHIEIAESGDEIIFTINDNGIGIAPEYREKVFEKFFRVPHGNTHNAKGYGLGLSYVARVIQKHRGSIRVQSQPGIGTSFIIHLPKQLS